MDLSPLAPPPGLLQDLENNPQLTDWIKRTLNQAEANDLLQHYHLDAVVTSECTTQVEYRAAQGLVPQRIEKRWCRRKEPIGHGLWGQVWLEQEGESSNQRAVKILRKDSMKLQGIDYKKEILALAKFSKRHYQQQEVFVKFIGWCEQPSDLFIYMEYFELGDLEGHINGSITEDDTKDISTNLLNGLRIMHHEGFTHRDLKPGNIFVVQRPPAARWWVKIGDFGISKRVNHKLTALYTRIGTPLYMAPEVTGYLDTDEPTSEYNKAVDMWSLGCVLYKVATQVVPFPTPRDLRKFCSGGPFPEQPLLDRIAAEGVEFVKGLLVPHPQNRLTAESALQTSWLSQRRRPSEDSTRIRAQLSSDTKEPEAGQTADNGTGLSEAISGISTSRLALQPEKAETEEPFESRRFSAYQMQKHPATSTNGMPMPPTETSPLPNRVREVVDRDSHSTEASVRLSAPGPRRPAEFNAKGTSISSKLKGYNHFEIADPDSEDKIGTKEEEKEADDDDGTEDSISASESEEPEPDEDLDASEEEENTSILSSQSSSLPKIIRIRDNKVAEEVTRLLETPVNNVFKKVGWIYIISPHDPPGILSRLYHGASCYETFSNPQSVLWRL
jgi:serine/threonine protein kinase